MSLMKRFAALIVVAIIFLLLPAVEISAQTPSCTGLSAADCKILSAADDLPKETSFNFDVTLSLKYKLAGQSGSTDLKGSGAVEGDTSGATSGGSTALNGLKMSADLSGPMNLGTTLSGNAVTMTFHMILVDGVLYYKDNTADQWKGFNLADTLARYQGANPLSSGSSANSQMVQKLMSNPQVIKAIAAIPTIKGFITLARTRNAPTLEGQKQIEFVTTYNILTLVKAKEMYPVYTALLKATGTTTSYSNSQMTRIAQVMATALNGSSFKITRWVGSKDNLYHALGTDFVLRLNGNTLGQPTYTGSVELHFQVQMTKIGQPVDITAPENADMIDANP